MTGRNLGGNFSICRVEMSDGIDSAIYTTIRWGYDTEEQAVSALKSVADAEGTAISDLVVISALFAADLEQT